MYNNDDIMSEVRDSQIQIEQLESQISNLIAKIGELTEQIELMPYKNKDEKIV